MLTAKNGESCASSVCKKNDGQTCSSSSDCVSEYCNSDVCAENIYTNTSACSTSTKVLTDYGCTIPSGSSASLICYSGFAQMVSGTSAGNCGCKDNANVRDYPGGIASTAQNNNCGDACLSTHVCVHEKGYASQCGDATINCPNYDQLHQTGCDDCKSQCLSGTWYYDSGTFYCGCNNTTQLCTSGQVCQNQVCVPAAAPLGTVVLLPVKHCFLSYR